MGICHSVMSLRFRALPGELPGREAFLVNTVESIPRAPAHRGLRGEPASSQGRRARIPSRYRPESYLYRLMNPWPLFPFSSYLHSHHSGKEGLICPRVGKYTYPCVSCTYIVMFERRPPRFGVVLLTWPMPKSSDANLGTPNNKA